MKKFLSFLLTTVMLICMLELFAYADYVEKEYLQVGDFYIAVDEKGRADIQGYYGNDSELVIPQEIGGYTVEEISGGFEDCAFINSIIIPDTVTVIGKEVFCDTGFYNNADNWENGVLYSGNHLLAANKDIESLNIKEGTQVIANGLSENNHSLKNVVFPSSLKHIGMSAFRNCTAVYTVVIKGEVQDINKWTFSGCVNLKNVVLNEGLRKIESGAFRDCSSLESVYLPSSVEIVDDDAFDGCGKFTDVYYGGTQEEWNFKVLTYLEGQYYFGNKTVNFGHIHKDENKNGMCDECLEDNKNITSNEPSEKPDVPAVECSCNCHKTGFMSFVWKIVLFFQKLFRINKVCSCGVVHY